MPRPLLVTALRIEHDALRAIALERNATLRCLGPGADAAGRLDLARLEPSAVLLVGVAGGLVARPPVRTSRVIDAQSGDTFTPTIARDPEGAVIVTAAAPAFSPDDKRALATRFGAHLVDNESAHVARACHAAGVPWGVLRAVSDGPGDTLPAQAPSWIDRRGRTRTGRVLLDIARRPSLLPRLHRLADDTSRALRALVPRVEQCLDALD